MVSLATASESLKVWKFEKDDLSLISRFSPPTGRCSCFAWNHTNQVVAVGGTESKIFLIHAHNGQILSSLQVSEDNGSNLNASSVALSSNSRFLATSLNNSIQVWDLKRRQLKSVMDDHVQSVTTTCFLPTGEIVSGDTSGAVRIWDSKAYLSTTELLATPDRSEAVTSLSISPVSSAHLATGYSSGMLGVWDTKTLQQLRRLTAHTGSLNSVAYSPINPKLVATAGSDSRVTLFDTGTRSSGVPSAVIQLAESVNITTVAFHEDALHAAIGLSNGRVMVYDWRKTSRPVLDKPAHDHFPVLALAFQVPKSKSMDASATGSVASATSVARTATSTVPASAPVAIVAAPSVVPATPPPQAKLPTSRTSEAGMSTPVHRSLQRLDQIISPIAPVRSNDNLAVHSVPPPPAPSVGNVASSSSGVANKYSLNHTKAFPEDHDVEHLKVTTHTHTAEHTSTSVHVDVSDDHALNHSRTFPEKHSPERVNPLRAARTAPTAFSMRTATADATNMDDRPQPRSAMKDREQVQHTSNAQFAHYNSHTAMDTSYPQTQLEVSFDRSVDSRSHSHVMPAARVPQSYPSPQKVANNRAEKEDFNSVRNSVPSNHANGMKSEHTPVRNPSNNVRTQPTTVPLEEEQEQEEQLQQARDPHAALRQAVRPVTARDLEESLQMLKYDLHREMQDIIKEQIRQFSIAKEDTAMLLKEMSAQMAEILQANKELRAENEYLRRIY